MIERVLWMVKSTKFFIIVFVVVVFGSLSCAELAKTLAKVPRTPDANDYVIVEEQQVSNVFLTSKGGERICHRGRWERSRFFGKKTTNTQTTTSTTSTTNTPTQEETTAEPTDKDGFEEVGTSWFKMGLKVVNKSTKYYLVINELEFKISLNWKKEGLLDTTIREPLYSNETISDGYCDSDYLYIVPPTPKDAKEDEFKGYNYTPNKKDTQNNLTLYVSGIPIPPEDTPPPQSPNLSIQDLYSYTVDLIVHGKYVDKDENPVSTDDFTALRKKISFTLPATVP